MTQRAVSIIINQATASICHTGKNVIIFLGILVLTNCNSYNFLGDPEMQRSVHNSTGGRTQCTLEYSS